MLERLLLVGLGYSIARLLHRAGAPSSGRLESMEPPEPVHAAARVAFHSLNASLLDPKPAFGALLATAPTIDDVARLYGGALASAENAQEAILEAWARFPQSTILPAENQRMSVERQRLGAATIAEVLNLPDVAGALAAIRQQTGALKAAAGRMRSAVTETQAAAAATDAVGSVVALATSFHGH